METEIQPTPAQSPLPQLRSSSLVFPLSRREEQEERQVQEHANVPFERDPVLPLRQVQRPAGGELVGLHPARGGPGGEHPGDEGPGRHQGVRTGLPLPGHGVLRPGQQAGGDLTLQQSR